MHKKIIMACMAIAAFAAFVVAPSASAVTTLTSEGKTIPVGTSITAHSTGNTEFTGGFNVVCSTAHLTGVLTSNDPTVRGEIPVGNAQFNGTGTNGDCTSALGSTKVTVNSKLCLDIPEGTDEVRTTGCAGNVTFTLEVTGTGPCKYSTASVIGHATTNVTPATVLVTPGQRAIKHEGGFFCPAEGELKMDFDLYTTGATPSGPPGAGLTLTP